MFLNMNGLPNFLPQILGFIYTSGIYIISMYLLSKVVEISTSKH